MGPITCRCDQSSYPTGIKNMTFCSTQSIDAVCVIWIESCLTASEEIWFENVDGRTDDGRLIYYKLTYEPTAQVS